MSSQDSTPDLAAEFDFAQKQEEARVKEEEERLKKEKEEQRKQTAEQLEKSLKNMSPEAILLRNKYIRKTEEREKRKKEEKEEREKREKEEEEKEKEEAKGYKNVINPIITNSSGTPIIQPNNIPGSILKKSTRRRSRSRSPTRKHSRSPTRRRSRSRTRSRSRSRSRPRTPRKRIQFFSNTKKYNGAQNRTRKGHNNTHNQ